MSAKISMFDRAVPLGVKPDQSKLAASARCIAGCGSMKFPPESNLLYESCYNFTLF